MTDPLARLRLTVALDIPRTVSRIRFWLAVFIATSTAATLIFNDAPLAAIVFSALAPILIQNKWEQMVKKKVNGWSLLLDSQRDWRLRGPRGDLQTVVLSQCIKSVFGYYLTLIPAGECDQGTKNARKSVNVMVWRTAFHPYDQQVFRYFSMLTNWRQRQGDRLRYFGDKV